MNACDLTESKTTLVDKGQSITKPTAGQSSITQHDITRGSFYFNPCMDK